jgi:hypothetical protein
MIKKLIKNLIILFFIIVIVGGIGAGIYFLSPEVKLGEVALLYKVVGKDKGFTGKVLTPGKYYAFFTEYNPFIHKIYKVKLPSKTLHFQCTSEPGVKFDINLIYGVKEKGLNDFLNKVSKNEADSIVKLYVLSSIKQLLVKYNPDEILDKSFNLKFKNQLMQFLKEKLGFFGINVNLVEFKNIMLTKELKELYEKYKEAQKKLSLLEIETAQKLKETKLANEIKEKNLQYMLKKAEVEKQIAKLKVEKMAILREETKKRISEEVELFSKPGGAIAAKLEAIRLLSSSFGKPEKVLNKVGAVFNK